MRCPFCKDDNDRVIDSRSPADGSVIRRRRECTACARRFTTYERLEEFPLQVVKKNGSREPFSRDKVLSGIRKACEKRPVGETAITQMVDRIENEVLTKFDTEVASSYVGGLVVRELHAADKVAYIRFASVYRAFTDPMDFIREAQPMTGPKPGPSPAAPALPAPSRRRGRPAGRRGPRPALGLQRMLFNGSAGAGGKSVPEKPEAPPPAGGPPPSSG